MLGARGDDGRRPVVVDMAATAFGRGAHVHARPDCLKKAAAGGLARAFKCGVVADAREIGELIALGCSRRIDGLIIGARRAKHVAVGDEARGAMASGAPLVIIARDAGGAVTKGFAQAVLAGNAISYKDKSSLGALLGRDEVAAVVVTDAGIAREIKRAVVLAGGATGGSGPVGTAGVATK